MDLWTGVLSWWKCHWPDLKSAGLFRPNLFLNSLKTSCYIVTLTLILTIWPISSGVLTSLLLPHLSSSLTDSLLSLNPLCHSKTDARFMQDCRKAVWSIPYISVAFFPSLKQNFIAHRSSKVSSRPDCIFEIHQQWQSGFSGVYSNCCCSCSFEPEIIKIYLSPHTMYSNNILNFQESTTILNAFTKKVWKLIEDTTYLSICQSIYIYIYAYFLLKSISTESSGALHKPFKWRGKPVERFLLIRYWYKEKISERSEILSEIHQTWQL